MVNWTLGGLSISNRNNIKNNYQKFTYNNYSDVFTLQCKVPETFLLMKLYNWKTTGNLQLVDKVDLDPVISRFIFTSNKFFYIQNKQTDI